MSKKFKKQDKHKNKKLRKSSWRKPRGRHNKQRLQKKNAAPQPKAGYRKPKDQREVHPSGYKEKMVDNTNDLEEVDPETEAARITGTVGKRKRKQIVEKAEELDIKILNNTLKNGEEN